MLDSHTITTVEIRANLHIGTVPFTGADFPYLKVVCGEPCDVWRKSAPLEFSNKQKYVYEEIYFIICINSTIVFMWEQ